MFVTNHVRKDLVLYTGKEYPSRRRAERQALAVSELSEDEVAVLDSVEVAPEAAWYNRRSPRTSTGVTARTTSQTA